MPAMQLTAETDSPTASRGCPLETGMRRLAPCFSRAAAETAEAFFSSHAFQGTSWEAPRIPEDSALHCSQKNIGEKYELLLNLTTDKHEYHRLFPSEVSDPIRMDAYCELANCICGSILADAGFLGEFGDLMPCVPCSGAGRMAAGSRAIRGAFRLGGAWIHFSFAVRET